MFNIRIYYLHLQYIVIQRNDRSVAISISLRTKTEIKDFVFELIANNANFVYFLSLCNTYVQSLAKCRYLLPVFPICDHLEITLFFSWPE
jgi:hypothetical protein